MPDAGNSPFRLSGTRQEPEGSSGRSLNSVFEPLQDIHFFVQNRDDDWAVDDYPEDVVMLAPMCADSRRAIAALTLSALVRSQSRRSSPRVDPGTCSLVPVPRFLNYAAKYPKAFFRGKRKVAARHGLG